MVSIYSDTVKDTKRDTFKDLHLEGIDADGMNKMKHRTVMWEAETALKPA